MVNAVVVAKPYVVTPIKQPLESWHPPAQLGPQLLAQCIFARRTLLFAPDTVEEGIE